MTMYTLRSGGTAHPEATVLQIFSNVVRVGGVLDLSADAHWKVVQRGAGANMSVDVSVGEAIVRLATGSAYPIRNTAAVNKVIGSNSSGNPRIDAVVVYNDMSASANSDSSNVTTLAVVAGTPAASPTAPSDADIATAIGSSNPFLRLANVAVANGAASIVTANITDTRVQWRSRHQLLASDLTYASSLTVDVGTYNDRKTVLTGNPTVTFANAQVDMPFIFRPVQDGTGSRTITWADSIDWFGGEPPLSSTANHKDAFMFILRSNGRYEGYIMGLDSVIS